MATGAIGASFYDELLAAGLGALPFCWSPDGGFIYDPSMTTAQISAVQAVYAAHNPTAPSWLAYQFQAQTLLTESDRTIARCTEHGVTVPATWVTYRAALRAIVGASTPGDPTQPLPTKPAYPAGT